MVYAQTEVNKNVESTIKPLSNNTNPNTPTVPQLVVEDSNINVPLPKNNEFESKNIDADQTHSDFPEVTLPEYTIDTKSNATPEPSKKVENPTGANPNTNTPNNPNTFVATPTLNKNNEEVSLPEGFNDKFKDFEVNKITHQVIKKTKQEEAKALAPTTTS
ncbi:hypothetical protein RFI_13876 [Reticulomyxa filosa]|uniref:Uncharacterized protein n=1 Tax=Reticulomyxa filosa TaxID=46433 RepID=X6NDA3_RETFI|nr:hypothetical protein RFI_13876 [Reticulomyxa filosa]|eukprot:ETO23307.1 hypothetical protein RFI_13876 [Reticulomyxa filosa]